MPIVIYAVGSPIVVEVEETCARLGLEIVAGIKNFDGPSYLSLQIPVFITAEVPTRFKTIEHIVPLFTPGHRLAASEEARRNGFAQIATIVDPTAIVASSTTLGSGTYVNSGAVIGAAGRIGAFAFINRAANIGHHAVIDDFVSVGPGVSVSGMVRIGRGATLGAGAVVLPEIEVGANSVVAAGAVVASSVPPNSLVAGVPARIVRSNIAGYKDLSI